MDISGNRMYQTLKKFDFVRLSTYEGETKAAEMLCDMLREIGVEPTVETFKAPHYEVKTAKLEVTEPFKKEYTVTGYGFSGSTAEEGIETDFTYVDGFDELDLLDVKGKIVLFCGGINASGFEKLIKAGAVALIGVGGNWLDKKGEYDLDERMLRPAMIEKGVLPTVCIHINDAQQMIEKGASRVHLTLVQDEGEADSRNVITEIKGTERSDEVIVFTAHYDSVVFSHGIFDNLTGVVTLLEMARHYAKNAPKRTVRFIFTGSEERGLLGSKAYVAAHEDLLENIRLCVNVDMTGPLLGRDCARVTGEEALVHAISYISKEIGFPAAVWQDIYSSDGIPFADKGIPAINFLRQAAGGFSQIHCRHDVISRLNAKTLAATAQFVEIVCDRFINSVVFPIDRKMPDNMVERVNKYLGKKPAEKK
ncbi:MAG: M20/M25/M40 family metallo-hydrolase [Clostridia bacterium]|nr:M20/M25/M40 family metallo-hydrolase [Clostridia bacterium]